jgi:hypothetical protein
MEDAGTYRTFIDTTLQSIRNEELFLIQLGSSYGCTLACICDEVTSSMEVAQDVLRTIGL